MLRTIGVWTVFASLLAVPGWHPASPGDRTVEHVIPFEFATRQPIVRVGINGGTPLPFVFDTGASIHVVDEGVARSAGIVGGNGRAMTGGGQAVVQASFADGVTFAVDAVRWERQRAAVTPLGFPDKKHFAGLIGAPILMRYVAQFDFPARVLRLLDPGAYRPPRDAVLVPFELQEDLPVVRAQVDMGRGPIDARLMLDTGAGSAAVDLNRPFVDAHGLLEGIEGDVRDRPAGIGSSAPFVYTPGKRLTLGGLTFDAPRVGLSRATQGSSSRSARDGIIGNVLLERFVMTVDYSRRVVAFQRGGGAE